MATQLTESKRNIVVLGKTGAGKSSVANNILCDTTFDVADTTKSVTRNAAMSQAVLKRPDMGTEYNLKVIDTIGLFDSELTNEEVMKDIKTFFKTKVPEGVNLILFVFQVGRLTPEERKTFKYIMDNFKGRDISDISALVITHCEDKNPTARERIVTEFNTHEHTKDIAEFMKKGMICVGFPKLQDVDEDFQEIYKRKAKKDTDQLHQLVVKSSDIRLKKEFLDEMFWRKVKDCTIL